MRKKWNLMLSITTVVLTLSLFAFGVYAALQPSFSISNQITFSPTLIAADVIGSVTGYDTTKTATIPNYKHTVDVSDESSFAMLDWDDSLLKTLNFKDASTPIVFSFSIISRTNIPFEVYISDYVAESTYFTNTPSNKSDSTLKFLDSDKDGSPKTLTLTITVKNANLAFTDAINNFKVTFIETTV